MKNCIITSQEPSFLQRSEILLSNKRKYSENPLIEGVGLVEDVFGAFDGEARGEGDYATWTRRMRDGRVLEPEKLALLEEELVVVPYLDVLALLGDPADPLGVQPELDTIIVGGVVHHVDFCVP